MLPVAKILLRFEFCRSPSIRSCDGLGFFHLNFVNQIAAFRIYGNPIIDILKMSAMI